MRGVEILDLKEPAPSLPAAGEDGYLDYPFTSMVPRRVAKKKVRHEEIKILDFVDSSKAIQGSSEDEEDVKRARTKKRRYG